MEIQSLYSNIDSDLKKDIKVKEILEKLDALLQNVPQLEDKRTDPRLVELICNYVENTITWHKKYGIDKKKVVMDYMKQKFSLHDNEFKIVSDSIEYMIRNGIIKKYGLLKSTKKYLTAVIKKRLF